MRPVGHVSLKESAEPSQASSFKCPEFLQASVGFSQVSAMMVAKRAEMLLRLGFTGGPAPSLLWPAATYRVGPTSTEWLESFIPLRCFYADDRFVSESLCWRNGVCPWKTKPALALTRCASLSLAASRLLGHRAFLSKCCAASRVSVSPQALPDHAQSA